MKDPLSHDPGWVTALAGAGVVAVFAAQYARVAVTNFGGFDEWLVLSLAERGLWSFPHANRPLQLLWTAPAALLAPCGLRGYYWLHGFYFVATGALFFPLARRLLGGSALLAFLAATFVASWAPLDMFRLDVVQAASYSGLLFAAMAVARLLAAGVERRSAGRVAAAAGLAFLAMRSYEGTFGLLVGAPLLFPWSRTPERFPSRACLLYLGVVGIGLGVAAAPLLLGGAETAYQASVLGADLHPGRYLTRLSLQYGLSLGALVVPSSEGWSDSSLVRTLAMALVALLGAGLPLAWRERQAPPTPRSTLARAAALGLVLAGLGFAPLVVSANVVNATRTQIFSAPGIALLLAAGAGLLASVIPGRARAAAILAMGAWVVAIGTGQIVGMQKAWDARSLFPAQARTLRQLLQEAPRFEPRTLVILLDESGAWPLSFTFRHALRLLYGDGVVGHVLGADQLFYTLLARPEGLESVPWPVLQGPWREPPQLFAHSQIVVYRLEPSLKLSRLRTWDDSRLSRLPAGTFYDPGARIGPGDPQGCARYWLERLPP